MKVQFNTISRDEQEMIHLAALNILERVGFRVKNSSLLRRLRQKGVQPVESNDIVYFSRQMVADAVTATPKQWIRTDLLENPLPDPVGQPYFIGRVLLNQVLDYGQNEPRSPRKQDIINMIKLVGFLPKCFIVYKVDCPCSDVPSELTYLETISTVYMNTSKHILANPINLTSARYYVEMGEAATGKSIRGQTWLSSGVAATSPLTIDRDSGDILLFLLDKGAPVNCFSMPISGVSAPVTLAGTIVQHTAEVLALITMAQMIVPGTPVGYSGMSTVMDLKKGNYAMSTPVVFLLANATITMAKYFGLPTFNPANYSDSLVSDIQCGFEKGMSSLIGMAGGSDVGMFGGDLHDAMTISYEQLLIDYDIWEAVCRIIRGVQVDSKTLAQEAMERVGNSGDWLTDPHTISWLRREEHVFGQLFVRGGNRRVKRTMLDTAHERVVKILDEDKGSPVSSDAVQRIDAYTAREKQAIQDRQR